MDLRQLRYFVAIAEQGSFSGAAEVLNVAQPALSLHVRNMEADLGAALLFRTARGVVPTEAGEILLRNARLIIGQFAVAEEEIRGHESEPSGDVRLGLPGTISQNLSVPLIIAARTRYPKINLRIAEAMSGFVLEWIRESRVDVAVLYNPPPDRSLVSVPVLDEELWLLGPAKPVEGVELPTGRSITFKTVAALPLILPSANHGLRSMLEEQAEKHSLALKPVIEIDSYGSIKELVEAGLGFSTLPFNSIAREVKAGRLLTWRISRPELKRSIHLVHASDRPRGNAVTAIHDLARETLLDLVARGKWSGAEKIA
ncbi:LysR substrate-binding domain-containing protein [Aestuariivirga sp.]|uniref:LysR substrate-binding domain-containing protein n=1 Tax=Aestuariivirga sp. TaxID=2650926 RepID=UPI0039E4E75E